MLNIQKTDKLVRGFVSSAVRESPFFVHLSPLTSCNLRCGYCYQVNETETIMSLDCFKAIICRGLDLGVSMMAFQGGEPLMWRHLEDALRLCTKHGIFTQLTSNGVLLDEKRVNDLACAGLDVLSVSLDGVANLSYSRKTLAGNPRVLELLSYARSRHGMLVSTNTVLSKGNIEELPRLMDRTHKHEIPHSIGFVVPSPDSDCEPGQDATSALSAEEAMRAAAMIIKRKAEGYLILDPVEYYRKYADFLQGEPTWDCVLAKKRTIHVSPNGKVYWCSKLRQLSNYEFAEMSLADFKDYKAQLAHIIEKCNKRCYSNCAYHSYYYHRHKAQFLRDFALPAITTQRQPFRDSQRQASQIAY